MSKIWRNLALVLAAVGLLSVASAHAQNAPQPLPDDRILGKPDAPVTIFEFASLSCPHCADFDANVLPKIKQNWIDTGKARLIYRDYPLDFAALKAAQLVRCAPPEQFYGFIDVLFQSQQNWVVRERDKVQERLGKLAKLSGMSDDKFAACMKDEALEKSILERQVQATRDYQIESTPTFYINGKKFVGVHPYDEFDQVLAAASKS